MQTEGKNGASDLERFPQTFDQHSLDLDGGNFEQVIVFVTKHHVIWLLYLTRCSVKSLFFWFGLVYFLDDFGRGSDIFQEFSTFCVGFWRAKP